MYSVAVSGLIASDLLADDSARSAPLDRGAMFDVQGMHS